MSKEDIEELKSSPELISSTMDEVNGQAEAFKNAEELARIDLQGKKSIVRNRPEKYSSLNPNDYDEYNEGMTDSDNDNDSNSDNQASSAVNTENTVQAESSNKRARSPDSSQEGNPQKKSRS
jgi:hypothetical protein